MHTSTKNKSPALWLGWLPKSSAKLPDSWMKARGLIRDKKQLRALERHVKKVRAEW